MKICDAAENVLRERFGHDCLIALATVSGDMPHVRSVNSFYRDGAFYVLTWGGSNKMRHIAQNPNVAICGDWFTAHGTAVNLGAFGKRENAAVAEMMRTEFAAWIGNGHTDLEAEDTCILRIDLTDGVLFDHGTRYDL